MIPLPLTCNRCGECCRHGGACFLRKWDHQRNLPYDFKGACEFLTPRGECEVMLRVTRQGGQDLLEKIGVIGTCSFQHLRHIDA